MGTDREPFGPDFTAQWNESWGSNRVGVYVEDLWTGAASGFGDPVAPFPLASVAKVLILAGTLEAVQAGRRSLASVSAPLDRMIRFSDNAAATQLWNLLGGAAGVDGVAARWGLSDTAASAGRGFGGTLSTAVDQVRLLKGLVGSEQSPLVDGHLREHAWALMTSVIPSQAWGVSAGVPDGWPVGLKDGWYLTTSADLGPAGRWRVHSVGLVRDPTGAERWVIAVLGNTWPSLSSGIAGIEAIAAQVAGVLSPPAASVPVPWAPAAPVPSGPPGGLRVVAPARVLDTRADGSTPAAGSTRTVDVSAATGPDAALAVVHLTSDRARAAGYLTAFACGAPRPPVSHVNVTAAGPASADAVVALGAGTVCVYCSATTDLVVDIVGAFTPGAGLRFVASPAPLRLLDSRAASAVVAAESASAVDVPGLDGWPVRAAAVNLTATSATAPGHLVAHAADGPVPPTSALNHPAGRAIAAAALVATSPEGRFLVRNSAPVAIVVDLVGVFTERPDGLLYQPAVPQRVLDTRSGVGGWRGPIGAGQTITVPLGVPGGSTAVGTLTAVDVRATGFLTAWAGDGPRPPTSNLNVAPGDTIANLVVTRTAGDGSFAVHSQSGWHQLVYDLAGWFS